MRTTGYKLNGYNATYERTNFDVRHGVNGENKPVLEVTDLESGITFIFETKTDRKHKKKTPCKI